MTSPRTVLIVDDSKVSRIMSAGLLRKLSPGIRIIEAGSADDARTLVGTGQPDWLLLDHNMPGTSGLDLATELVPLHPHLRIALLTANIQEATQNRAATLGIAFFRKPISESVIADVIARLSAPRSQEASA